MPAAYACRGDPPNVPTCYLDVHTQSPFPSGLLAKPADAGRGSCFFWWLIQARESLIWQGASSRRRCLPSPMALDGQNAFLCGPRPTSERSAWLARSVPGVKIGLRNHAGEMERPARVRFCDLASANRRNRVAQALASQRACPRHLFTAQASRRQSQY